MSWRARKPALLSYHPGSGTGKCVDKMSDRRHVLGICPFHRHVILRMLMGFIAANLGGTGFKIKGQMLVLFVSKSDP